MLLQPAQQQRPQGKKGILTQIYCAANRRERISRQSYSVQLEVQPEAHWRLKTCPEPITAGSGDEDEEPDLPRRNIEPQVHLTTEEQSIMPFDPPREKGCCMHSESLTSLSASQSCINYDIIAIIY